jgi:hypothetical protein
MKNTLAYYNVGSNICAIVRAALSRSVTLNMSTNIRQGQQRNTDEKHTNLLQCRV